MDATALHAFTHIVKLCKKRKITLLVTGVQEQPKQVLYKAGVTQMIGEGHIFPGLGDAVSFVQDSLIPAAAKAE